MQKIKLCIGCSPVAAIMVCCTLMQTVQAQTRTITYDEAVALARANAPKLKVAAAEIEAAAANVEASDSWRQNPSLSLAAGPRFAEEETTVDVMLGLSMPIVVGSVTSDRRDMAQAQLKVAQANSRYLERAVVQQTTLAFAELLYLQHRQAIAKHNLKLALEVQDTAKQRQNAGDVGALDPTLATVEVARARAMLSKLRTAETAHIGTLKWLTSLDEDVEASGELASFLSSDGERRISSKLALEQAKVSVFEAEREVAAAASVPDLTVGVAGGIEEKDILVRGTMAITLPFVWTGSLDAEVADARAAAQRASADATSSRIDNDIRLATTRSQTLAEAVRQFEQTGMQALEEASRIATASYKAGAIPLSDLLVVRRELVAAEEEYSELLLLAARARIELRAARGEFESTTEKEKP